MLTPLRATPSREVPFLAGSLSGAHHVEKVSGRVKWAITVLTATTMAGINLLEITAIEQLVLWKFGAMQHWMGSGSSKEVIAGTLVLLAICLLFAIIGVATIVFCAPNCGGSGLPENKCYLNGSPMTGALEGFFTMRTLVVRVTTSILANAAGYPVGREGPTVVIGSNVAFLISQPMATRIAKRAIDDEDGPAVNLVNEDYVDHLIRLACGVGGACGMSMIFNTPIGGLLYMFEEITSSGWPVELTLRAFVGTTVAALLSYWWLDCLNLDVHQFVIYAFTPRDDVWEWKDMPWFVAVAAVVGAATSLHTRAMLWVTGFRGRRCPKRRGWRVGETVSYAAFCTLLSVLVSLVGGRCTKGYPGVNSYVQLNCPYGYYNEVASILVNTSHSAVKMLFACAEPYDFAPESTLMAFSVYLVLNVGLSGLPVPGGAFTGTMLLGGLLGRCAGCLLWHHESAAAHPGIYSVIGCAAMLCGFKRMNAAVVMICVQTVNNVKVAVPVMVSVSVALAVNRAINRRGHDDQQIANRRLPFLEARVPHGLMGKGLVANHFCEAAGKKLLQDSATEDIQEVLEVHSSHYAVFDPNGAHCLGLIERKHLLAAADLKLASGTQQSPGSDDSAVGFNCFVDSTPFLLCRDMPVERFWGMFSSQGVQAACVITPMGEFVGVLTRQGLVRMSYDEQ